jgi:hypothetical protein
MPRLGFLVVTLIALWGTALLAAQPPILFVEDRALDPGPRPSAGAADWARLDVDTAPLATGAERLQLELLPGKAFVATLEGLERRGPGDLAWRGRLEGVAGSQVVLTLRNGYVVGAVFTPADVWEVTTAEDGGQLLVRLDSAAFPPCAGPVAAAPGEVQDAAAAPAGGEADPADDIHVMVLYTPEARDAAGGVAAIETTAQAAVDAANTAFGNSATIAGFTLVHTALAAHSDTGDLYSDLPWLASDAGVAALRDQQGADMVSLLVNNGGGFCGLGYLLTSNPVGFGPSAFQVTARTCAVGNLSWAHEHGHNIGLSHDPANASPPASLYQPDSYGHYHSGAYRTVMSYATGCVTSCTRQPYFSNPTVSFMSLPTGILDERDNHRTINLTAPFAANWRLAGLLFDGFEGGDFDEWDGSTP